MSKGYKENLRRGTKRARASLGKIIKGIGKATGVNIKETKIVPLSEEVVQARTLMFYDEKKDVKIPITVIDYTGRNLRNKKILKQTFVISPESTEVPPVFASIIENVGIPLHAFLAEGEGEKDLVDENFKRVTDRLMNTLKNDTDKDEEELYNALEELFAGKGIKIKQLGYYPEKDFSEINKQKKR